MTLSQNGDRAAYGRLLNELLPILRLSVLRRWRRPDDVDDIVQEILMSIHSVRHTYDPGRPFTPWLYSIVAHRVADAARRHYSRSAMETLVDEIPETLSADDANSSETASDAGWDIQGALSTLPPAQREAIELLKVKGLSLKEASAATGRSVGSLKIMVHRAKKAMQRILK